MTSVVEYGPLLYVSRESPGSIEVGPGFAGTDKTEGAGGRGKSALTTTTTTASKSHLHKAWFVVKAFSLSAEDPTSQESGDGGEDENQGLCRSTEAHDRLDRLRHLSHLWFAGRSMGCTFTPEIDEEVKDACRYLPDVWGRRMTHTHETQSRTT